MRRHIVSFLICLASTPAWAWGPHSEIAQAALDALGSADPLVQKLGSDAPRLAQYVWMADWRQQLLVRSDEVFYSDDYLLFPAATRHYQHICPEVKRTYAPYFRRALQALRTESPRNAARWIGSLLHFTTDTGSPPHAAGILGPVHSKMENWVNAKLIHVPGYQPQLLGENDAAAEAGFLQRMDGLIAFSRERSDRCRADVDADHREAVEPVVLESALETARVTADLLHTLGVLAGKTTHDASLSGQVRLPAINHASLARLPARVLLQGTLFSTLTEPDGSFAFRHLPAGDYQVVISAPGIVTPPLKATLKPGAVTTLDRLELPSASKNNLVRNSSFVLHWVSTEALDHWSQPKRPGKLMSGSPVRDWEGEWIPLTSGVSYQLSAHWKAVAEAQGATVFVRTKAKPDYASLATESTSIGPNQAEVRITGSTEAAWAQLCIRSPQPPELVLESVELLALP